MKYVIKYLTVKGQWRDFYGRMIDSDELSWRWNEAFKQVKHDGIHKYIMLFDENGNEIDV